MPPNKTDLINDFIRVSHIVEHTPTMTEYKQHGKYCPSTAFRLFPSWKFLCAEANLPITAYFFKKPSPQNKQELLEDFCTTMEKHGTKTPYTTYYQYGKFSTVTARKLFGSFHNLMLIANLKQPETYETWFIEDVPEKDGHWLSGFIEGEACFMISPRFDGKNSIGIGIRFTISQREDRSAAIYETARILGIPQNDTRFLSTRRFYRNEPDTPYTGIIILTIDRIILLAERLCPLLEKYPLRGSKRNDFMVFRAAVKIAYHKLKKDGKRHFTPAEKRAFRRLARISKFVKKPHVSLQNTDAIRKLVTGIQ